jgi:hypothetical protein
MAEEIEARIVAYPLDGNVVHEGDPTTVVA